MKRPAVSCLVLLVIIAQQANAQTASSSSDAESISFSLRNGLIAVSTRFGDLKDRRFLFDTGSTHSVVDERYASSVGDFLGTDLARTTSRNVRLRWYESPEFRVGDVLILTSRRLALADLRPFEPTLGVRCDGLIGLNCLRGGMVQINFDRKKIVFDRSRSLDVSNAVRLPLKVRPSVGLELELQIGPEQKRYVTVDTGYNGSLVIDLALFGSLSASGDIGARRVEAHTGLGGESENDSGRLSMVRCGPFSHRNVDVSSGKSNRVGIAYLSRYIVTFDISNNLIYLEKGKRYAQPERFDRSGLRLDFLNNEIQVSKVEARSPGQQAGLAVGDCLKAIDGRDLAGCDIEWLREQLRGAENDPPRPVRLTIRRGEKTFTKAIDLIDYVRAPEPAGGREEGAGADKAGIEERE